MDTITDPFVGTKIGRYQIESVLGRGRGSVVYRAFDLVVNRQVAIKVLEPSVAKNRQLVQDFLRDTGILAEMRHPHILPIYEVAEHAGTAYFVRLLTDGGTLRTRLRETGRLTVGEAAALLRPVASALDYAHRQGILHRNLRPTNILLTADSHVYLTDFSLPGKENQASAATTVINATAAPEYISPEQARGGTLDARSDIYVLGIILYEALVGRPPFRAERPEESPRAVMGRHLQEEPLPPSRDNPAVGQAVDAVLLRALAKDPEQRFPTAAALFYALGEAEEQERSTRRRQGAALPTRAPETPRTNEGQRATRPIPTQPLPVVASPDAIPTTTDLDTLLATLAESDTSDGETTTPAAAPMPPPQVAATPSAVPEKSAAAVAKTPPASTPAPHNATQAAQATTAAPKRSPLPLIGGIGAVLAVILIVVIVALSRGNQPEPVVSNEPAPIASANASTAATLPQPTVALSNNTQPTASTVSAPSAAAAASAAPSVANASSAPSAAASAAIAQPVAPVRQEAIVYAEQQEGSKQASIVAVGPDGKDRRVLSALPGNAWGPRIATNGRSIVFSLGSGITPDQTFVGGILGKGQHDLYLANLDGTAPHRLTTTTAWNAGWSWSPDGKTLALTSNRDGNWEIYLMSFPSQEMKRLTTSSAEDAWPNWTPDGKQIVFMSTRDGYPQLYRMNVDGSNVTRLITSESSDTVPVLSPDGTKIAYITQTVGANDTDIFVANIDGSNATRVTKTGDNYQPTWSPDSARLAFTSTRDGDYNIYVVRADGQGLTQLTNDHGNEVTPTWGVLEFPPGAVTPAPLAQLPLVTAAVALSPLPTFRRRND